MSAVKGPDSLTLQAFISEHQVSLLRLCYLYLHDVQLAEDAVQETFIKAVRSWDDFRGDASRKTWLTRIAIHVCCDMRRASWFRRVDRRVSIESLPLTQPPPDEKDQELTLAIMRLPLRLREAVLLYYYQELNVVEIAKLLGISQPSVSERLKRARKKLKEYLEGEELS